MKSWWDHFCHMFSSFWAEIIREISPLVKFEILGGFVNTLTADDKYPVWGSENLSFPIQTQLS